MTPITYDKVKSSIIKPLAAQYSLIVKALRGSLNSEYEPFLASENFKIEGIVKGVITNKPL